MIVVLLTHAGDIEQAITLLEWILKLGQNKAHDCLIAADAGTPFDRCIKAQEIAAGIFREVRLTTNEEPVSGWPAGCYSLFRAAVEFIEQFWTQPFLILEPDAIPLKPGWLDEITKAYDSCVFGKFMGHIYSGEGKFTGRAFMSGIAVYPADTATRLPKRARPVHWDVDGADVMVSQGSHTPLIKHFFGEMDLPPTFVQQKSPTSPRNAFTLEDIGNNAVIFHRNKDGSLMRLLRKKLFPQERIRPNFNVVFPVCAKDINAALAHSAWLIKLCTGRNKWAHEAVVSFDLSTPVTLVNHLAGNLRQCFDRVSTFSYPRPPFEQYPHAANWAFQCVAHAMARQDRAWLWMEADAVALRYNWLEVLQDEYESCGKDWMGPIIPGMLHLQGTSIYPANAAQRMPEAMRCVDQAFDMMSKPIVPQAHDAHPLMFHCWTILNGQFCPVGGGSVPENISIELARTIPREAVFIHRIKGQSLINLLISGAYRHE